MGNDSVTFLETHAGSSGRIRIREMRWHPMESDLVAYLKSVDFPSMHLPYGTRIYELKPGKAPKKLNEDKLKRRFFAESVAEELSYVRGCPLYYEELQKLPDGAYVWAHYMDYTDGVLMNDAYKLRRSHSTPHKWYLLKKGKDDESFVQDEDARRPYAQCFDLSAGLGELYLYRAVKE